MSVRVDEKKRFQWKYAIPLIVWMIVIFLLSSVPGDSLPHTDIAFSDKMAHLAVYGILSFFSIMAFKHYGAVNSASVSSVYLMSIGGCLLYGASDEIHQLFVPQRSCDILDFCTDAAAIIMLFVFNISVSRSKKFLNQSKRQ